MGRPRKKIEPEQVKSLAAINCSYAEIAAVVGCNESTLTRRFAQVIKEGREVGKSSLKRWAWENASKGNTAMQIFLLKNMCEYRDLPKGEMTTATVEVQGAKVTFQTGWSRPIASEDDRES